jgi:hypothetical protein
MSPYTFHYDCCLAGLTLIRADPVLPSAYYPGATAVPLDGTHSSSRIDECYPQSKNGEKRCAPNCRNTSSFFRLILSFLPKRLALATSHAGDSILKLPRGTT